MRKTIYSILPILAILLLTCCSACRNRRTVMYKAEEKSQEDPFWGKLLYETYSAEERENICLSPLSAQLALAMASTGAEGETLEQICHTIGLDDSITEKSKDAVIEPNEENPSYEVGLANSIWINERLKVKRAFIDSNKKLFDAEVNTLPFNDHAVETINSWCRKNTNGKIESIIDKIDPQDMMFLINALYFKAPWLNPFRTGSTTKEDFTTDDGNRVRVDMMKQTFHTAYYSDNTVQIVSKPFKEKYDMLFILPARDKSIGDAIKHLADDYGKCIDSMKHCRIELSLPKFKSEYDTSLKDILCGMGMEKPFGEGAQFGGISKTPLYIEDVIQKTFISIDEEGAEAAAVTSVTVGMMSARPQQKITMRIDRPFLYIIRERKSDTILFIGKVGNPNK